MPSISVAMATYRGSRYLTEQLESIAAQTLAPIEIHIGDDGSDDGTEDIVRTFSEATEIPVFFHKNESRLGYSENFIQTAKRCRGEWIAFSDQDDVWLPNKLQACMEAVHALGSKTTLSVIHTGQVVTEDLKDTGTFIPGDLVSGVRAPLTHELFWAHYGFAQVFRRELLHEIDSANRVPTVFTNIDRYPHDVWISVLSNVLGDTLHLDQPLVLYRRHANTTTGTAKSTKKSSLSTILATGGDHYDHLSEVAFEAAICLDAHAKATERGDWKHRLQTGSDAYGNLGRAFSRRARAYRSPSLLTRFRCIYELATKPGYFGLGASSLGAKALIKDMALALFPVARLPERPPT